MNILFTHYECFGARRSDDYEVHTNYIIHFSCKIIYSLQNNIQDLSR